MVWTAYENGLFNSEGLINESVVLDSSFMSKLVDNLLASGVNNVEEVGDIIYAGLNTTATSKNMQRLAIANGAAGDAITVGSDDLPVWYSSATNVLYRDYVSNPALYDTEISDSSLIGKQSGVDFIEAYKFRVPSNLILGNVTGCSMVVSTIGELGDFEPIVERYVPGSRVLSALLHTDSTELSISEHDDGYAVWSVPNSSSVYRVGFVLIGKTTGVAEYHILDIKHNDRVPDFDVLSTYGANYKIDVNNWVLTKSSLESSDSSNRIRFVSYSSRPSLAAVSGVTGTGDTTSVALSWNDVFDATSYSVQYRSGSNAFAAASGSPVSDTSITISGLTTNLRYDFRVHAIASNYFDGQWSDEERVSTLTPVLDRVSGVGTSSVSQDIFTVSWDAVDNATAYTLDYRESGDSYGTNSISVSGTSRIISGLDSGTTYYVRVKASASGYTDGAYSFDASVTTSVPRLDTPNAPTLSTSGSTGISVSWSSVDNATSYTVYWYNGVSGSATTSSTSYTISGLTAGYTYYVYLVARSSSSSYSNSLSGSDSSITLAGLSLSTPAGLSASIGNDDSSISFSWNSVSNADGYTVQWRSSTQSYNSSTRDTNVSSISATLSSSYISRGVTYFIRVRAYATGYTDSSWREVSITVPAEQEQLDPPTNFVLSYGPAAFGNGRNITSTTTYSANATHLVYQYYRSPTYSDYGQDSAETSTSSPGTFSIGGPTPNVTFYVRVKMRANGYTDSDWVYDSILTTLYLDPPTNFVLSYGPAAFGNQNNITSTITYSANATHIVRQYYRDPPHSAYGQDSGESVSVSPNTFSIGGPTPNVTFYVRVKMRADGYVDSTWVYDSIYTSLTQQQQSGSSSQSRGTRGSPSGNRPQSGTRASESTVTVSDHPIGFFYAYTIDTVAGRVVPQQPYNLRTTSESSSSVALAVDGVSSDSDVEYRYRNAYVDDGAGSNSWVIIASNGSSFTPPIVDIATDSGLDIYIGEWIEVQCRAVNTLETNALLKYSIWTPGLYIDLS